MISDRNWTKQIKFQMKFEKGQKSCTYKVPEIRESFIYM